MRQWVVGAAAATATIVIGCGSAGDRSAVAPAFVDGGDAFELDDGGVGNSAGDSAPSWPLLDGSVVIGDAGAVRADRFITRVVSFTPTDCAGFGAASLPGIVMGPPVGGGADMGGVDVVSLGSGGEIIVSFEPNAIVDGPGTDLVVFENPFNIAGNPKNPYAEPGEISVSDDGTTWKTFPCTATTFPYGSCAGWHPVYSNPTNQISPFEPAAGGDRFDLADLGVTHARYVRVRDRTHEACSSQPGPGRATTNGFDLDAMAIVNAELP